MKWINALRMVLHVFIMALHSLGICLIRSLHRNGRQKTQHTCILNLSLIEILLGALRMSQMLLEEVAPFQRDVWHYSRSVWYKVWHYLGLAENILCLCVYFSTMVYLSVDRLLEIKFNIRYPVHVTHKRVKYLLMFTWSFGIAMCVVFSIAEKCSLHHMLWVIFQYIVLSLELCYVVLSTLTYVYIFLRFKETRKQPCQTIRMESSNWNTVSLWKTFRNSRFYVVFFLILTYILFIILPDILALIVGLNEVTTKLNFTNASYILLELSYLIDAFIYIFMDRSVRTVLIRKVQTCLSNLYLCGEGRRRKDVSMSMSTISDGVLHSENTTDGGESGYSETYHQIPSKNKISRDRVAVRDSLQNSNLGHFIGS